MKMFDGDKVKLIDRIITEFYEVGSVSEDSATALLNVIHVIVKFDAE